MLNVPSPIEKALTDIIEDAKSKVPTNHHYEIMLDEAKQIQSQLTKYQPVSKYVVLIRTLKRKLGFDDSALDSYLNMKKLPSYSFKIKNIGKNSKCPCNSGKKYVDCCKAIAESTHVQFQSDETQACSTG